MFVSKQLSRTYTVKELQAIIIDQGFVVRNEFITENAEMIYHQANLMLNGALREQLQNITFSPPISSNDRQPAIMQRAESSEQTQNIEINQDEAAPE